MEWYLDGVYKDTDTSVSGCSDYSSWTHTFSSYGTDYTVEAVVYDSRNDPDHYGHCWWEVDVGYDPEASRESPSQSSITLMQGQSQTFTASVSDTDCDLNYVEWYLDGVYKDTDTSVSGCSDTSSWQHTFSNTETYEVKAIVYDDRNSGSHIGYTTWSVTVNQAHDPEAERYDPSSSDIRIAKGVTQTFTTHVTDDDGDLYYVEWYLGGVYQYSDTAVSGHSDFSAWTHTFSSYGDSIEITAVVFDSRNDGSHVGSCTWYVDVGYDPEASRNSPSQHSVSITQYESQTFTADVSDDDGDLYYVEWYLAGEYKTTDMSVSGYTDTSSWFHTFSNTGTYEVKAIVYDARNSGDHVGYTTWSVTVNPIETIGTINFSDIRWDVRPGSESPQGPGSNYWSNSTENIWKDGDGQLHLKITYRNGTWYCPEIYTQESFGYGKYYFFVSSRVDELDKNVVGGLFTYLDDNNEIDIEFSKWGQSTADNSQYVVQPYYHAGNTHRFNTQLNGDYSTHCIDWHQNHINFFSLHGHYYTPPDSGYIIDEWEYTGVGIPTTSTEKVHLNLWLVDGNPPSDGQSAEMIVKEFKFIPPEEPKWTFMVFMNGDNNLEGAAIDDFGEMASAGSTAEVNLVVQIDRIPGFNTSNGDWTGTKRFLVTNGMSPTPANAVQDLGESNMGHPQTLIDFVNWAKTNYPADYYAVIIWDHGSGWQRRVEEPIKSISDDWTSSDTITMPELRQALATITNSGADKLDIVGFDACLMAMEEVDYQIMPYADYRVSSEETEPYDGWDYDASMTYLISNPTCTAAQLSTRIVNDFINFYGTSGDDTLSAVNLNNLNSLVTATSNLGNDLKNNLPLYRTQIESVKDNVEHFDSNGDHISDVHDYYVDLHHFATLIKGSISDPTIQNDAQNVMDAITNIVIAEGHGSQHSNSRGVSIYFPDPRYNVYMTNYETDVVFSQDTQWDEFLAAFFNNPPTAIIDSITPDPAEQGTDIVSFIGHGTDTDGSVVAYNWRSSIDGQLSTSASFNKPASELSVGTHTIYFKVQDDDGAWSTEDTEDLTINPAIEPELSYSPTSHNFWDKCEGETDSTTLEVWNSGTDTLTYSLSESCGWVGVHPTSGSSTGEHDTITVDIDTTGLSEGSHTCDISISSNGGSGTFTVTVNVVPCEEPVLAYSPASHDFGDKCEGETDSTTFEVWNSGSDTLIYSLSESCGWVEVNPTSGSSTGEHDTITVDVDTTGLSEGSHTCDISISSNDVSGTFTVRVNIVPKPDLIITEKWLCWPDNCTICYNVTNIGDGPTTECHNTTLYVDGVAVAHDHVPVDLAPGESYTGCFDDYDWTYTPPSDNITVCADNNETLEELDETNNCLTNIWMCGDVNKDRMVNVIDVVLIYKRALDPGYPLDLPWAGDVNCDRNINVIDVVLVYKRALDPGYDLNCCCEEVG